MADRLAVMITVSKHNYISDSVIYFYTLFRKDKDPPPQLSNDTTLIVSVFYLLVFFNVFNVNFRIEHVYTPPKIVYTPPPFKTPKK